MRRLGILSSAEEWNRYTWLFDQVRLPAPDQYGFFSHPDLDRVLATEDELTQDEVIAKVLERHWESQFVSGEDLVNEETLEYDVRGWKPEPPAGDGWRIISVFDTEDGPYAMFVRPRVNG